MPLTLTELEAITQNYFERTSTDIYFQDNILLYKLLGGESGSHTIPGGKKIQVTLEYDKGNSGSYGNTTKLPLGKKEVFNAAFFRWAAYYSGITIDRDDQMQNSGEQAIVDLVRGKILNAQKSIRTDMGTDIYDVAATTDALLGLGDLFSTVTATAYGEIAEDNMAMWGSKVSAVAEAIDFSVMQGIRRLATVNDNNEGKPNLYITTQLLRDAFEATLQVQARYSDPMLVKAGFDNILFGGMPVVADNKQNTGTCDGLNLNFLEIKTHQDFNFTKPVWSSPIDQPDTKVAFIRWAGNLVCKNRKAHARHTALTA